MPRIKFFSVGLFLLVCASSVYASYYDNRWIPFIAAPRIEPDGDRSRFRIDTFAATASKAVDDNERQITIQRLYTRFDQHNLADAMVKAGYPNLLPSAWRNASIPWLVTGKIQAQGVTLSYFQQVCDWFAYGFDMFAMRVNTNHFFRLQRNKINDDEATNLILGASDEQLLDDILREMFELLGLRENHSAQVGFGDINFFVRAGYSWDYALKMRFIDIGARLGVFIPTGLRANICAPASIPFGADGHWGIYGGLDGLFEIKEDIKIGFYTHASHRFKKTSIARIPLHNEPINFGAEVGPLEVEPGTTFVFSPFISAENLRNGLGLAMQYTATYHSKDCYRDKRCLERQEAAPSTLVGVGKATRWGSDYVTLNVFYDFGKVKAEREQYPILWLRWDIPAQFYMSKQVAITHRLCLGVEFAF